MDGRECRERAWCRLVVVRGLRARAVAGVVPGEDKGAAAADGVARRLELSLVREQEFERAVVAGTRRGDVKAEYGRDVVGGKDAVVLGTKRLVGLRGADLRDVVRELILALCQVAWAAVTFVGSPVAALEGAL